MQGIITNDPKLLQTGMKDVMYTALLNSHGRLMHDAFLYATGENSLVPFLVIFTHPICVSAKALIQGRIQHAGEPFGILADVDKEHLPDLVRMLNRYAIYRLSCSITRDA